MNKGKLMIEPISLLSLSLSLSLSIYNNNNITYNDKMNECTACQTIQAFISLHLSGLAVWRQSFVPKGRINLHLMVINIHARISFNLYISNMSLINSQNTCM